MDVLEIYLKPSELILFYVSAVNSPQTRHSLMVFKENMLIVPDDNHHMDFVIKEFLSLSIIPDYGKNRKYYDYFERYRLENQNT